MLSSQQGVPFNSAQKIKNMGVLKVDNFLGCWSLRTGTLFLGTSMLLSNLVMFLVLLFTYDEAIILTKARAAKYDYEVNLSGVEGLFAGLFFHSIMGLLLSGTLIAGVLYKIHCLLLPYLICMGIFNVLLILSTLITSITFTAFTHMAAFGAGIFFSHLFFGALSAHFWLVVYTHYKELEVAGDVQHIKLQEEC